MRRNTDNVPMLMIRAIGSTTGWTGGFRRWMQHNEHRMSGGVLQLKQWVTGCLRRKSEALKWERCVAVAHRRAVRGSHSSAQRILSQTGDIQPAPHRQSRTGAHARRARTDFAGPGRSPFGSVNRPATVAVIYTICRKNNRNRRGAGYRTDQLRRLSLRPRPARLSAAVLFHVRHGAHRRMSCCSIRGTSGICGACAVTR